MQYMRFLEDISPEEMLGLRHSWQLFDATIDTDLYVRSHPCKPILYNIFV